MPEIKQDPSAAEFRALIESDPFLNFLGEAASSAVVYANEEDQVKLLHAQESAAKQQVVDAHRPNIIKLEKDHDQRESDLRKNWYESHGKLSKLHSEGHLSDSRYITLSKLWANPTSFDYRGALEAQAEFDKLQPGATVIAYQHNNKSSDPPNPLSDITVLGSGELESAPQVISSQSGEPELVLDFVGGQRILVDCKPDKQVTADTTKIRAAVEVLTVAHEATPDIFGPHFGPYALNLANVSFLRLQYPDLAAHIERVCRDVRHQFDQRRTSKRQTGFDDLFGAYPYLKLLDPPLYDYIRDTSIQIIDEQNPVTDTAHDGVVRGVWARMATAVAKADHPDYVVLTDPEKGVAEGNATIKIQGARPNRTPATPSER